MTGAADGSNVLSEAKKAIVISRDHGLCILCGMDPTQVAHIIPRKSGDHQRDSRVSIDFFIITAHYHQIGRFIGFVSWLLCCLSSEKTMHLI